MLKEGKRGPLPAAYLASRVLRNEAGGFPVRQLSLTWASRP